MPAMVEHIDVAILGAGLTGLSAGLHLGDGTPHIIFEKSDRVGGHCVTNEDRGFRLSDPPAG